MSYLELFNKRVKFITNNENQKPNAFHILSNEYVFIVEDVQNKHATLTQRDYQEYFAVHQLFIDFMDSFIINAVDDVVKSALSDFKRSLVRTNNNIHKQYNCKNNFMKDLSARFLKN